MVKVTKRDGRTEDFIIEKVVVSMVKSGAPADVAREIARNVESEATGISPVAVGIPTEDIRTKVLEELRKRNPEWEKNWLVYDRSVKKRTG